MEPFTIGFLVGIFVTGVSALLSVKFGKVEIKFK